MGPALEDFDCLVVKGCIRKYGRISHDMVRMDRSEPTHAEY